MQKVVNILINHGNELPKGVNKDGNLEPHAIGFDMENILEKLVKESFIIHFHKCLQ